MRLQKNCGFRLTKSVSLEAELEIDLPAREMLQPLRNLSFGGYGENVPGSRSGRIHPKELFLHTRGSGQDGVGNQR